MQRRSFLKTALASVAAPGVVTAKTLASFAADGKVVLLYNYANHALRSQVSPFTQTGNDCVSHAAAFSADLVSIIQHFLGGDTWYGPVASEVLHMGPLLNRPGRHKINIGISVSECVDFMNEYGLVFRRKYGKHDFTKYSFKNCIALKNGLPDYIINECKKHKMLTTIRVKSWDDACEAIFNLQPVVVSSDIGFKGAKRDEFGFAQPRGKWRHAWSLIGIDNGTHPGGCLMSSHGSSWVKGPKRLGQPEGSIWVKPKVLDTMLQKYGGSYALADLTL